MYAWWKNQIVAQAITGGRWMQGMHRISSAIEVWQFVTLWSMVQSTQLTDIADDIAWRFTQNGSYTPRLAYLIQFNGTARDYEWNKLWATKVEHKCKMFVWLALQNKIWTADRVAKHGGQPNMICQLCRCHPETAIHMLTTCPYSVGVWQKPLLSPPMNNYR
jgi:hypothetical protein